MTHHIARRVALLLPALLGVSLATFALLRLIPGDPAQVMLGEHATAEQVARYRAAMGLDEPLPVQYLCYLGNLARGDWGRSLKTNLPVTTELAQRLPATIELSLAALLIAGVVGLPLGTLAAARRNSPLDWLAAVSTLVGVSMPLFWLGLLLSNLFGYQLGWLPPSGRLTIGVALQPLHEAYPLTHVFPQLPPAVTDLISTLSFLVSHFYILDSLLTANPAALADALCHLILPALTLSTVPLAVIVRLTRACLLDALAQDYVRTARAKGLSERAVVWRHALKNAALPVLTAAGLQLGLLFSGAILTETIFSWPGLGQLVVDRVLARDYPTVQGVVLVSASLFLLINLATDVGYALLDPRIRYG